MIIYYFFFEYLICQIFYESYNDLYCPLFDLSNKYEKNGLNYVIKIRFSIYIRRTKKRYASCTLYVKDHDH